MNPFEFRPIIKGELLVNGLGKMLRQDNTTKENDWNYVEGRADMSGHYYLDYKGKKYYVHKEVARLFLPVPPELEGRTDLAVHHLDEDKTNNRVDNLEWIGHAEHTSLHKTGEAHHGAKLTREDVIYIRGEGRKRPAQALAREFGVGVANIRKLWRGEGWTHLNTDE